MIFGRLLLKTANLTGKSKKNTGNLYRKADQITRFLATLHDVVVEENRKDSWGFHD
jgi:hypothetical protein